MPRHHPLRPHKGGPAGLHQVGARLREMKAMGASSEDLEAVIESLREVLPHDLAVQLLTREPLEAADVLSVEASRGNVQALDLIRSLGRTLIAGEMPPHLIFHLLDEGLQVVQLHDPAPHGGPPPHFRHLADYPNFNGVTTLAEAGANEIGTIVVEAFLNGAGALVSPIAVIAARFWADAPIVAVMSDHRAPHHRAHLSRAVTGLLFWE